MSLDTDEIRARIKNFTTFVDVIALALAESSETEFSAETHKWAEALYDICQSYASEVPELRSITFIERPPLPPQSDQVYEMLTSLAKSREISLPNPQFERIVISDQQKDRIRSAIGENSSKYPEKILRDISKILETRLSM